MNCSCDSTLESNAFTAAIDESRVTVLSQPMLAVAPNVLAASPAPQSPTVIASLLEIGPVGWVILVGLAGWYLLKERK